MKNIAVVLFDFGGVIADEGFHEGLYAIGRQNGLVPDLFVETGYELVHATGYVLGKATEKEFWQAIRGKTGISQDDATLRHEILSRFTLREWMLTFVRKLRAAEIITGVLSDQTDWLDELNGRYGFYRHFDHVFNSFHMGTSKREVSHFEKVLMSLNTKAQHILFIDDNAGNCARAKSAGINVIRYRDRITFLQAMIPYFPLIASEMLSTSTA